MAIALTFMAEEHGEGSFVRQVFSFDHRRGLRRHAIPEFAENHFRPGCRNRHGGIDGIARYFVTVHSPPETEAAAA